MVVLIVDDLTTVVSGLISGIDWTSLGVTKVLKAYNTFGAKDLILSFKVDLMLCDIEMPAENGLSLFRWVRDNEIDLECIFLTSHADFQFAKEAIKLGSFDYILQPARYEDITKSVIQAIKKIELKKETLSYSNYGQLLYHKKDKIIDGIMSDLFLEKSTNIKDIETDLKLLKLNLTSESEVYLVIADMLKWDTELRWDTRLLRLSFINICSEIFSHYGQTIILSEQDNGLYVFLIFNENNELIDAEGVIRELLHLKDICKTFFKCEVAFYSANKDKFSNIQNTLKKLKQLQKDNVLLKSDIYWYDENTKATKELKLNNIDIQNWVTSILNGCALNVRDELIEYLNKLSERENFGANGLKRFYHSYMQILYLASERIGIPLLDMFKDTDTLNKSLQSYKTIEDTKALIITSLEYIHNKTNFNLSNKSTVDIIIEYIYNNIEEDIRRDDIAKNVYLHPDYISRLFKKETGVSLKEFIIISKMKQAQVLLKTTNIQISIVATKVGYSNFSHFSQVYKKILGITPTEEREKSNLT